MNEPLLSIHGLIVNEGIQALVYPENRKLLQDGIRAANENGNSALGELLSDLEADYLSVKTEVDALLLARDYERLHGLFNFFSDYEEQYWQICGK